MFFSPFLPINLLNVTNYLQYIFQYHLDIYLNFHCSCRAHSVQQIILYSHDKIQCCTPGQQEEEEKKMVSSGRKFYMLQEVYFENVCHFQGVVKA